MWGCHYIENPWVSGGGDLGLWGRGGGEKGQDAGVGGLKCVAVNRDRRNLEASTGFDMPPQTHTSLLPETQGDDYFWNLFHKFLRNLAFI